MDIITGRIYKPDRLLYYIQPTEEEKELFFVGKIPQSLAVYDGAFGTYDCPGLFRVQNGSSLIEVIGIEFRPGDSRINYPQELAAVPLPKGFMVTALFTDVDYLCNQLIDDGICQMREKMASQNLQSNWLRPMKNPRVIQIFTLHNCNRVLIDAEPMENGDFLEIIEPSTPNEKVLYQMAYHDLITGHYNWNYLWPHIIGYGMDGLQDFSFVHFDVKDFNSINVVYGHDVANNVLSRIVGQMNRMDWVYGSARCDNDNFAMLIKDMPEEETRQKLYDFFDGITVLEEDPNYHIYYRCGVVPMRNTLLLGDRVADAGKQAQRLGNRIYETEVLFYTDQMHDELEWSIKIKAYLDTAIRQDEFLVYLQPKYDINTEELKGAEALVRWMYHGRKLLSPALFIPIFEAGGLISKLDDLVLNKVCGYIKEWESRGLELYPISVNLSRKSLGNPNLTKHLTSIVDSYGVSHSLIEFELTESAAYDNQDYMISVLRELRELGFKISMDDFGTGYSSLSLLTVLPIDTIKIDKSFVDHIGNVQENKKECATLKHIIAMIEELNLNSLAEGVEDKEQIDLLREYGCEIVQGYYYSKPLPVLEYEEKLK